MKCANSRSTKLGNCPTCGMSLEKNPSPTLSTGVDGGRLLACESRVTTKSCSFER